VRFGSRILASQETIMRVRADARSGSFRRMTYPL
jgi:hypothetical protein